MKYRNVIEAKFLARPNRFIAYVEIDGNKEDRPFTKIGDSFKKIIITKDIVPAQYDSNGILTINIYDFLLNPSTLNQ